MISSDNPHRTKSPKRPSTPNKAFQKYLKACEEIFENHDGNVQKIKHQEAEIKRLKASKMEGIKKLEEEKSALVKKLEKHVKFGETYKQHMNKVVNAQNALKVEADKIRETSCLVMKAHESRVYDEEKLTAHTEGMRNILAEIKANQLEVNKALTDERSALALARQSASHLEEKARYLEERLVELDRKDKESTEKLTQGKKRVDASHAQRANRNV